MTEREQNLLEEIARLKAELDEAKKAAIGYKIKGRDVQPTFPPELAAKYWAPRDSDAKIAPYYKENFSVVSRLVRNVCFRRTMCHINRRAAEFTIGPLPTHKLSAEEYSRYTKLCDEILTVLYDNRSEDETFFCGDDENVEAAIRKREARHENE